MANPVIRAAYKYAAMTTGANIVVQAGDWVWVGYSCANSYGAATCTDGVGSYTALSYLSPSTSAYAWLLQGASTSGTRTITIAGAGSSSPVLFVLVINPNGNTLSLDGTGYSWSSKTNSGTTLTTSSFTTTASGDFLISFMTTDNVTTTYTDSSGWTNGTSNASNDSASCFYYVAGAAAAYNENVTIGTSTAYAFNTGVFAIKVTAAGGSYKPYWMMD